MSTCLECHRPFAPRDPRQKLHPECRQARAARRERARSEALKECRKSPLRHRTGAWVMDRRAGVPKPRNTTFAPDFLRALPELRREMARLTASEWATRRARA